MESTPDQPASNKLSEFTAGNLPAGCEQFKSSLLEQPATLAKLPSKELSCEAILISVAV